MSGWQLPAGSEGAVAWDLPGEERSLVATGPSGLVLGESERHSLCVRLFGPRPVRLVAGVPDYVLWLLAFRAAALGAQLTVLTAQPERWGRLAGVIAHAGGSVDVVAPQSATPGRGRPYRPSLLLDDSPAGVQRSIGSWQAVLHPLDLTGPDAVFALRQADLALAAPVEGRAGDHLRRAYALGSRQALAAAVLAENEVAVATPRRLRRVAVQPTPGEYRLLFG